MLPCLSAHKCLAHMIYLIVFNASPENCEDTLYYFHCDIREYFLKKGISCTDNLPSFVFGVLPDYLDKNLKIKKAFYFDKDDNLKKIKFDSSVKADIVHFLFLSPFEESRLHRFLSSSFQKKKIKMVNPYNKGILNCESKFRTYEILRENDIPTPLCFKISKFNKIRAEDLKEILKNIKSDGIFIQPECGTEGIDCRFFRKTDIEGIIEYIKNKTEDLIIRKRVGEQKFKNPPYSPFSKGGDGGDYLVLRINVTYDGTYHADSGYAVLGKEEVVSVTTGAEKKNINEVLDSFKKEEIDRIKKIACKAAEKIFRNNEPSLLVGVDMVLGEVPCVIDVNPRPVVVGSRIIGNNKISLGKNFGEGIVQRWNGGI